MSNSVKKIKIPHTYTIIFAIIIIVAILSWLIPSGQFDRVKNEAGRLVVVPGSYHLVKSNPQGFMEIFIAPVKGIVDAAEIVAFVLVVGGAFGIINRTGAIEAGISYSIKKLKGKELVIIPICMTLFGLGGTTFGMLEETLPFYMIFIPLMMALGYDSLTGMAIVFIGAGTGTIASTVNPFAIGIAQAIAQLSPGSGFGVRAIIWVVIMFVSITFVMWHAIRVKKNPEKSIVYELDKVNREHLKLDSSKAKEFTINDALVIAIFAIGMTIMVFGVLKLQWSTQEIAMIFTIIGIFGGIVGKLNESQISDAFIEGARDLVSAAVVIGIARSIILIAQDGKIIDTILNSAAIYLSNLPKSIFINLMLIVQNLIAFFVPSSSAHAALTISIMAPLGDLIGVSRQHIVTAYQLGSGLTNLVTPTNGVLMAALTMARIPWIKFVKFIVPLVIILWIISSVFMTIGLNLNY